MAPGSEPPQISCGGAEIDLTKDDK